MYNRKTNRIPQTVFPHGLPQSPVGVPHNGSDLPHEQELPICRTCVSPIRKGRRSFNPMTIRPYTQSHPHYMRGWDFLFLTTAPSSTAVSTIPCRDTVIPQHSPCDGVTTPPQYSSNSRAKVGPNSYARGDYARPCYARQRSLKREPLQREISRIPGMVFPTRAGDTAGPEQFNPMTVTHTATSLPHAGMWLSFYQMRRKAPAFRHGDIRRSLFLRK